MSDTIVTDDDAWLDLRVGETCLVKGVLESIFAGGHYDKQAKILLKMPDWSNVVLDVDGAPPRQLKMLRKPVTVRARRTEDGLKALAIWTDGGAPIPL